MHEPTSKQYSEGLILPAATPSRPEARLLTLLFASCGILCGVLGFAAVSSAVGFGPYFEYSHGNGEIETDSEDIFRLGPVFVTTSDVDIENNKFAIGIAIDTNVAADKLFNYRLNLGFQRTRRDFDDFRVSLPQLPATTNVDLGDVNGSGFTFNNEFGFGILRTDRLRLWAGPSLRIGVDVYDTDVKDLEIVDLSVGVGASLGVNIHAGPLVSVALTTGYQYTYIAEFIDYESQKGSNRVESLDGYEHVVKAGVTVFFRTPGDHF